MGTPLGPLRELCLGLFSLISFPVERVDSEKSLSAISPLESTFFSFLYVYRVYGARLVSEEREVDPMDCVLLVAVACPMVLRGKGS